MRSDGQIGFVLLSHREPAQLLRLTRTLTALYGGAPIVCHHDMAQAPLDKHLFGQTVRFVEDWLHTSWAHWSVVTATLRAIRTLYEVSNPDHFVVLSGADYPIAPAEKVVADLRSSGADAFIDGYSLQVALRGRVPEGERNLAPFRTAHNFYQAQLRYTRAQLKIPRIRRRAGSQGGYRVGASTITLPFDDPRAPFRSGFHCFVGSQWFCGSRRAAKRLLAPTSHDEALRRHYRFRMFPEESYFQTVLCNDPDMAIDSRTFRYIDWREDKATHPKELGMADLPAMLSSGQHFARKFVHGDPVLDALDEQLGVRARGLVALVNALEP